MKGKEEEERQGLVYECVICRYDLYDIDFKDCILSYFIENLIILKTHLQIIFYLKSTKISNLTQTENL
jgi:hypothetical protein